MPFPPPSAGRVLLLAGALLLTLAACGRRGPLEPPSAQAGGAPAAGTAVEAEGGRQAGPTLGAPAPGRPSRSARRTYTVPKDPFILDPLL